MLEPPPNLVEAAFCQEKDMFGLGGPSGSCSASPPSPPPTVPWAQQAHAYIASHEVPAGHLSNVFDNELTRCRPYPLSHPRAVA